MHKNRVCAIVLFLVGIISTNFLSAQNISLDEAIQNAVNNIEDSLQQGTKVAILNFSSTSEKFTDYVIEELAIALVNGKKLVVVDRKDLELIRKEMNFQLSGEVSDESAQRIGVMLGAQSIISGSLVDTGSVYRFRVNTINVESAVREAASSLNINGGDEQTVFLLTGSKSTLPVQNNAASEGVRQNINNKRYKIGDVGPAGGIVFYAKGVFSNGWQYLEAAPAKTEFTGVSWGLKNVNVPGTEHAAGSGKQNTQIIMDYLKQNNSNYKTAASVCAQLEFDGYKDWFLPSKDELDFMYKNLKLKGLGNLNGRFYLSSSQNNSQSVWHQSFENGQQDFKSGQYSDTKTMGMNVRAIRAF